MIALKELINELKSKDTWHRVRELISYDPTERKKGGFKYFGMPKEYEIPFIIVMIMTIISLVIGWLIVDSIYPTK